MVTDNGTNVVKAVRLLREANTACELEVEDEDDVSGDNDEDEENSETEEDDDEVTRDDISDVEAELPLTSDVKFRRMNCMAHTLQLIIKKVYIHYSDVLSKAHQLVAKVRKSSVVTEKLMAKCGKTVIADNSTRWNSTFHMIKRLLEIKPSVAEVLSSVNIDSLLVDDWTQLEQICVLLEPFATQTDILQTDGMSLSSVIPAILDLQCHLQQFAAGRDLTRAMLADMAVRFAAIMDPTDPQFNPLPAAACLVDPNLATVLFTTGGGVIKYAKAFLVQEV